MKALIITFSLLILNCLNSIGRCLPCKTVVDTFIYITIDIRDNNHYPIIMNGISSSFKIEKLSKGNVDALIRSFYRQSIYSPDIYFNYKNAILACMGDSLGSDYYQKKTLEESKMIDLLERNSKKLKFKMKSGQTVFIQMTKIIGSVWEVPKGNPSLYFNSDELDISKIKEISICYIPFEIYTVLGSNVW